MKHITFFILLGILIQGCSKKESANLIITNGKIYTVNEANPIVEAVAIKDGKILALGSSAEMADYISEETQLVDLTGMTMTPGFIESHAHLMGIGYNKLELDLMYVQSYDELVDKVAEAVSKAQPGEWITGRGWHQDKWLEKPDKMVKGFQTNDLLNQVSPNNPVFLRHASGHATFANAKALELAGINNLKGERPGEVEGGEIILDELGNPTGVLTERASSLVGKLVPAETPERAEQALTLALQELAEKGITSFHDAGSGQSTIDLIEKFKKEGKLTARMYVMLAGSDPELLENWYKQGPRIDSVDHLLSVRSIKLFCDGALGSRGAWLLEEYSDRPGHFGHETLPMEVVGQVSEKAIPAGFQVNSHAIGDRANREVLDQYEGAFGKFPDNNDLRFRIEHAQHIDPEDIPRFGEMGVIAAMQAIHLSSDRPWAIDRLGEKRIVDGAYVWQKLLQTGAVVTNGTDAPVEPLDPIPSFYASITRKTLAGTPEGGYEASQKLSREEALKAYTLSGAYAEFEEGFKGSIEVGKAADFTVFDQNIMEIPEDEILKAKVMMTVVGGKIVYQKSE
ncbi:amidohydrolase [Algoriphagus lutimaris]|uniref:amidohydrolase n=1 Tax=Algoriphagus lutimaris TaxID=613197 RepID=UPI00196AA969|nr:amidohydrolase [Algoriphagus lutimaris]MBN3520591.1 amidohydrolase [Algoriphagus lutimaris]